MQNSPLGKHQRERGFVCSYYSLCSLSLLTCHVRHFSRLWGMQLCPEGRGTVLWHGWHWLSWPEQCCPHPPVLGSLLVMLSPQQWGWRCG